MKNKTDELTERMKKLEIQVNCLRKQILDLEGKKFHTFDSAEAQRQLVMGDPIKETETVNEKHESNASWRNRTTPESKK